MGKNKDKGKSGKDKPKVAKIDVRDGVVTATDTDGTTTRMDGKVHDLSDLGPVPINVSNHRRR